MAKRNEDTTDNSIQQATTRDLRHLTRTELLELLLEMGEELEKTKAELETLKEQQADREIKLSKAGSIAEAALALSGIFEAAQNAADDYLNGVKALVNLNLIDRDAIAAELQERLGESDE